MDRRRCEERRNGDDLTYKAKEKPGTVKLWYGIELLSEAKE